MIAIANAAQCWVVGDAWFPGDTQPSVWALQHAADPHGAYDNSAWVPQLNLPP
jgi:hypothetical protein